MVDEKEGYEKLCTLTIENHGKRYESGYKDFFEINQSSPK
jgi:hypothetical protein